MEKEEKVKWYFRSFGVIILLFFVLGPFALPILFKSPRFNGKLKILLTIAVTIYTIYRIFAPIEIGRTIYTQMQQYQDMLK